MRRFIVKIIMGLVPSRKWRQYLAANFDFFDIDIQQLQTKVYGKIWIPIYNRYAKIDGHEPQIYNADGTPLRTFFLRDKHIISENMQKSKYFMFDRYNFELPVHFYTHNAMRQTMGTPDKKYGLLIESESIVPQDYRIFERNPNLAKEFAAIFTYSDRILDKLPNAKFVPFAAGIWNKDDMRDDMYMHKTKNVSMLCSHKCFCDLHKYRFNLAHKLKREHLADTYGTFDGGKYAELSDVLNPYRYSFCMENDITSYYFSERFTSALAAQTIPIYLGAKLIDKFFNPDGIIKISVDDDIEKILKQCTPEEYERRLPAVLDNYNRVKRYTNMWNYIYEQYLQEDLE